MILTQHEWKRKLIWILAGTRPEVIKQAPLYFSLRRYFPGEVAFVSTGQHRELLRQALDHFSIIPDVDLALMEPDQTLNDSFARVLRSMERLFEKGKPRLLIVQGDTTSAAAAALAAYQTKIPILHNEAGLRSFNMHHPFPEEYNRRMISLIADFHAAPTNYACDVLMREGVPSDKIFVTGNTGIDALVWTLQKKDNELPPEILAKSLKGEANGVLITAHRRENQNAYDHYFRELANFIDERLDLRFVLPIHPNNRARPAIEKFLKGKSNCHLTEPLSYGITCRMLSHSRLAISDSGGIQEEAASLGLRVLVCRKTTERPEAVTAGLARLADPDEPESFTRGLEWAGASQRNKTSAEIVAPIFGSGSAAENISAIIRGYWDRATGLSVAA